MSKIRVNRTWQELAIANRGSAPNRFCRTAVLVAAGAIGASTASASMEAEAADCAPAKIHVFDAPDAGTAPSSAPCYLGCSGTVAYNINLWGAITGYYVDNNNLYHGFVRSPDGVITEFDPPGSGTVTGSAQGTVPASINDAGEIAGQYQDTAYVYHGFVRHPDGTFETFEAPAAGKAAYQGTLAYGINQAGEVAGFFTAKATYRLSMCRKRARHATKVPMAELSTMRGWSPVCTWTGHLPLIPISAIRTAR